jgi:hypothetical protein
MATLDEAVELWNNMWMADQVHDETIAENVQAMQDRCESLLNKLRYGIEQLFDEPAEPVHMQSKKCAAPQHSR